jgi:predicted RNase H-like HicB family nuclease
MNPTDELLRTDELPRANVDVSAESAHITQPHPGSSERELPAQLIGRYVNRAMRRAEVKPYPDGTWFAEIPGFRGVWANEASEGETLSELEETLHEWILLKIQDQDRDLPVVDSIDLNVL